MTTLLLRADATPVTGVGHLSRCVAVAAAARARGWEVALCGTVTSGRWLLGDLPVVAARPADVVLVDHYGIGEFTSDALVVSMEDGEFGRRRADIVVDANLAPSARPDDGSPVVLRGPGYAPLRPAIRAARATRRAGAAPPRVVVVMGGGTTGTAAVAATLTALRDTGVPAEVVAISAAPVPGFAVTPPTPDLPALFAGADLVVSAAGVTLLEVCCVGVPTALVAIADNQAAGYAAAVEQGLVAGLGTDPRAHVATLRRLLLHPEERNALGDKAMAAVDGKGADRILDATGFDPVVRPATEADTELLLAWRNDSGTRAWSRTTAPVSPAEHTAWLRRVLADPDRRLFVAEHHGTPVGTVRFDRDGQDWEVSITVAPGARGRRLAAPILLAGERAVGPATVHGRVHVDNAASLALFTRAGYRREPGDGPWRWFAKTV